LDQANGIMQGFDEFMNLVIDDAVEVKQATKTDAESRRSLGQFYIPQEALAELWLTSY
jgi:small nuclear ribonucleoprotein E